MRGFKALNNVLLECFHAVCARHQAHTAYSYPLMADEAVRASYVLCRLMTAMRVHEPPLRKHGKRKAVGCLNCSMTGVVLVGQGASTLDAKDVHC